MQQIAKFEPPKLFDEKKFFSEFLSLNQVKRDPPLRFRRIFFDTFDWRLYNRKLLLFQSGDSVILSRLYSHVPLCKTKFRSKFVFIWDFPAGPLKDRLKSVLGPRALLKVVETANWLITYRILDDLEKTVVRLNCEETELVIKQKRVPLGTQFSISPVKGYDEVSSELAEWLAKRRFKPGKDDVYHQAIDWLNRKPGDYSAKLSIHLSPAMRSDTAAKLILRFLLEVMKRNEEGIRKDIDTEFLHDFRVAVRRTRSALSQIKFVFSPDKTENYKNFFSRLGKMTNQLRDLDVYLLHKEDYRDMLPYVFKMDMDPLFVDIKKERSKELSKVVQGLNSENYTQMIGAWQAFLSEPAVGSTSAKNAEMPIIHLACDRILRKHKTVIQAGNAIHDQSEDQLLHDLRIECKKLRYLLEFFSSLFPEVEIKSSITLLKKLQDNLGRFQDLCVHERTLRDFVMERPCKSLQSKRTAMAVGSLVDRLHLEKQEVRGVFANVFAEFSSTRSRALYQKLFAHPGKKIQ